MRRGSPASGVLVVFAGIAALVAGCAVPTAGQASYGPPRVVGSVAMTGADADKPAASQSRHSRRTHPDARPSSPSPSTEPPTPSTTLPPAPPPATSAPSTPTHQHRPAPRSTPVPRGTAESRLGTSGASLPEFAVCLSFYQLAHKPSADFRSLPTHASERARTTVARSFRKAHAGMARALERSGLPRRDIVYARGTEVAEAMAGIAEALPTGRGVSDRRLRTAFASFSGACAR